MPPNIILINLRALKYSLEEEQCRHNARSPDTEQLQAGLVAKAEAVRTLPPR